MRSSDTLHGTLIAWLGKGVLIMGLSGTGKSQLALAMMAETPPAHLIGDDRIHVREENGRLIGAAPPQLQGLIERFGMGLERHEALERYAIDLVVELKPRDEIERMPDPDALAWRYENLVVPKLILPAEPVNGPSSVRTFLQMRT